MKKLFLLVMTMIMALTLIACGGNNDENNATLQAKMDEADSLVQEVCNWYKDNGYLEGDTATEVQAIIDKLTSQMDEMKAAHQKNIDNGGYSDEDTVTMTKILDDSIAAFKEAKEGQKAFSESMESSPGFVALTEKFNELVDLVNEASTVGGENGWGEDEAFTVELDAAIATLDLVKSDLDNPDSIEEEYLNELLASFDELIPTWQSYLTQVSEPYVAE
ncbi:MAG: hypothetical protein ACYDEX_09680 [Mobilitalea sp.]